MKGASSGAGTAYPFSSRLYTVFVDYKKLEFQLLDEATQL